MISLIIRTAAQQVAITVRGHPFGSREMALPDALSSPQFFLGINLQNDAGDLSPIGAFRVGVEQAQIDHEMPLVVSPVRNGSPGAVSAT
jgi:hypothetical protein